VKHVTLLKSGFTLIELLIVIAIILILIAIALPNFLEAQLRAMVTNAESEMRSIKVAVVSYSLDHPFFPADIMEMGVSVPGPSHSWTRSILAWKQITTPVQYMTSVPEDRFLYDPNWTPSNQGQQYYRYLAAGWRCGVAGVPVNRGKCKVPSNVRGKISYTTPYDPDATFVGSFTLLSDGPDREWNFGEWVLHRSSFEAKTHLYSPTNGTRSAGDLVTWGP
jgi:prepilin-type N-terminal cleavage/methylation domain-containing protein